MRQRLRIPIVVVLNSFDPGGTERQMTELICRLDRRRFAVHVACLSTRGTLRAQVEATNATVVEFPLRGLASIDTVRQMLRFARWCRDREIQIVHACDFYSNVFALPAAALARVPVRVGSRRDVSVPERTAGQHRLQRLAYWFAHRVVANSAAAVDRLREEGVPERKIANIGNGLDLAAYAGVNAHGRAPHADARRPRVVTTVAHLRPGKGHDVLLKAAAHVIRRFPDTRFHLVGDGSRRPELERQASALRISAQVRFLGLRTDVPAQLHESDLFAFPSLMEASPNALIEAMAARLPIVATRAGGIPEVIEHERNGLLVPPGDDRALAGAIVRLIDRPDLAARLADTARRDAESRFTFERMVGQFQQLYLDELAARTTPSEGDLLLATIRRQ